MKAVLISIQPKWCELIANGKKTVEVRKTAPKLPTPFKCYIYCTKGHFHKQYSDSALAWRENALGKVIGEFICDRITPATIDHIKDIAQASCLSLPEMWEYGRKSSAYDLFGWHISDLRIYDEPRPLSEFFSICPEYRKGDPRCGGCGYYQSMGEYPPECACDGVRYLIRPPQSWCYVEG